MNSYIGHPSQIARVEEHRLVGGKGDGMRIIEISNGKGLALTVCPDRCCDISRLSFGGINMGYFSPCGYVAPTYYDSNGTGFLKSFTAGFLTTCGLQAVGSPCTDEGEALPLHGSIGNTPAEHVFWTQDDHLLCLKGEMNDEGIFARKLRLQRVMEVNLDKNEFTIEDTVTNGGGAAVPVQILYHFNMGYPLLDEDSTVNISSQEVLARNGHAKEEIANWMRMEKPQAGYEERCYYHICRESGTASVYQPKLNRGLAIHFNPQNLPCFTQWKMMGIRDYVLGLEPGNSYPDGRNVMREKGLLQHLEAGKSITYHLRIEMLTQPL